MSPSELPAPRPGRFLNGGGFVPRLVRGASLFLIAFVVFAIVLLLFGKDPLRAYVDIFSSTLGSPYGFSEVLVKMIPLVLTAVAVAIPASLGLINVGGEGQLFIGGMAATWAALTFPDLPAYLLLPLMALAAFAGGGAWAAIAAFMRAKGWVEETISTLLMNYIAVLLVDLLLFGPWKDPASGFFPQTPQFVQAARLPRFFDSRIHLGILFAAIAVVAFYLVLTRTRWGLEMRSIGGNSEAARRNGVNITRYIVIAFFVAGGLAGLAGMGEASAIHLRLTRGISANYGFIGFLISWMAGGNAVGIVAAALLLAIISAGGDMLQMTQAIPGSVVSILMALILFVILARRGRKAGA